MGVHTKREVLKNKDGFQKIVDGIEMCVNKNEEDLKFFNNCFKDNRNIVMTERGTGKTFQLCLRLKHDKNLVVIVATPEDRNRIEEKLKEVYSFSLLKEHREELRQILLRVFTIEEWNVGKVKSRLPYPYTIHVEDTEKVLEQLMEEKVSSLSTGFYSVYGYTHEFDVAETVNYDFTKENL